MTIFRANLRNKATVSMSKMIVRTKLRSKVTVFTRTKLRNNVTVLYLS